MMINKLVNILEDETVLYKTLLDISSREREAMIRYSLTDLIQCHKERKTIYLKAARLQENRLSALTEISNKISIPRERLNISTIVENIRSEECTRLEVCRNHLRGIVKKLSEAESGNKSIAQKSLSFIDQSMKILTGFTSSDPIYLSNGALEKHDNPGCRVKKEA